MEEQTVSSKISCFHHFVIIFIAEIAQGATQMFTVDVYERQL